MTEPQEPRTPSWAKPDPQQPPQPPTWGQQPPPPAGPPTPPPGYTPPTDWVPPTPQKRNPKVLAAIGASAAVVVVLIGLALASKHDSTTVTADPATAATTDDPGTDLGDPSTDDPATDDPATDDSSTNDSAATDDETTEAPPAPPKPDTVTYKVTGSSADIQHGPSGTSLQGHSGMNVTKKLGNPAYYAITAQLQGGGHVTCEIKINGKVMSTATASGGYNIAMCEIVQDPISGDWVDANQG